MSFALFCIFVVHICNACTYNAITNPNLGLTFYASNVGETNDLLNRMESDLNYIRELFPSLSIEKRAPHDHYEDDIAIFHHVHNGLFYQNQSFKLLRIFAVKPNPSSLSTHAPSHTINAHNPTHTISTQTPHHPKVPTRSHPITTHACPNHDINASTPHPIIYPRPSRTTIAPYPTITTKNTNYPCPHANIPPHQK
eukprot:UN11846